MSRQRIMIPEAFKVLPPLSPELPAPPRAPPPHRVAPPLARREKTAFVILNDETPPPGRSRSNSPSGRVSPFRGRGFREETSRHASREPSPSPDRARKPPPRARSRSTSRLPVAMPRTIINGSSNNLATGTSGIPKPIYRRNSLSPSRATQVLNQVNRNRSMKLPHQGRPVIIKPVVQSPRHSAKNVASPKRVGPPEISKSSVAKPPIPKIVQGALNQKTAEKENDKRSNVRSPYRRQTQPTKPDVMKSPSRIPRTRSVSRGREGNVRASSPVRAVVRASPKIPQGSTRSSTSNGVKNGVSNVERRNNIKNEKKNGPNTGAKKNSSVKNSTSTTPVASTPVASTPVEEKPKFNLDLDNKIPTPIEAVVSTLPGKDDKTPELEKREIQETPIEVQPRQQVQSPPPVKPAEEKKPEEPPKPPEETKESKEEVPEPTVTLVRTTTAPALELAQPDVIPTILSKGEQEISKSISEGPSQEDKDENPGSKDKVLASVESVRSNSSVETVRAAAKVETDVEVLSANNLMKADGHNRSVAWDKEHEIARNGTQKIVGQFSSALRTPDMSPLNNSVHPLDTTLPLQPPKPTGCCGRLCDRLCCRTPGKVCCCIKTPNCCSKLGRGLGALCNRLNCCKKFSCSSCCGKAADKQKTKTKPTKQRSRLRDCLSRLSCFRWSKCCRKSQPQPPRDEEEGEVGCCPNCKYRSCGCFRAVFCLNRACCQRMRACCRCTRFGCCRSGGCCGPTPPQLDRRKSLSVRKSQTSITQGIPKLDPTLVEHQSMMRGAVPVLPVPLAWMCCILNVFLPGSGTLLSGVFCLCFGKPRFSVNDSYPSRLTAFLINLVVSVSQLFTIIFCLVGWGWSIWWGVMMVRFAKKHKRILIAERTAGDQPEAAPVAVNQNHDVERAR